MNEKTMINDILEETKAKLSNYQNAISECENIELRQTLKQLRDNIESFQYEIFKVACAKGYYTPSSIASTKELQKVKKEIENL